MTLPIQQETFSQAPSGLTMEQSREGLEISEALALCQPDDTTVWNTRKRLILSLDRYYFHGHIQCTYHARLPCPSPTYTPSIYHLLYDFIIYVSQDQENAHLQELQVTLYALQKHPKSYSAWYHRRWVLTQQPHPDFKVELKLLNKLLTLDGRNFHAWSYRIWVIAHLDKTDELSFTKDRIEANFSNFSAWHHRANVWMASLQETQDPMDLFAALEADAHWLQSAYYTEPGDQAAWFYLRWLVDAQGTILHI